jgi:hypothetical protein
MGGTMNRDGALAPSGLARYRTVALFVATALFVAVKVVAHDIWAVGFGLAMLCIILLTPDGEQRQPWRDHALRVVSACFVVMTLATIVTTLIRAID